MALFSFYNMRKPRQFDHKPIYWDPHKEALEERISKVKREMGVEEPLEEYKPHIKGTFIEGTSHPVSIARSTISFTKFTGSRFSMPAGRPLIA